MRQKNTLELAYLGSVSSCTAEIIKKLNYIGKQISIIDHSGQHACNIKDILNKIQMLWPKKNSGQMLTHRLFFFVFCHIEQGMTQFLNFRKIFMQLYKHLSYRIYSIGNIFASLCVQLKLKVNLPQITFYRNQRFFLCLTPLILCRLM